MISTFPLARRYALALRRSALAAAQAEAVGNDVECLHDLWEACPEFRALCQNPEIETRERRRLFRLVFEGRVTALSLAFLELLVNRHRSGYLRDVLIAYRQLCQEARLEAPAVMSSARPLSSAAKQRIQERLSERLKKKVIFSEETVLKSRGGFRVQGEDWLVDLTVENRLASFEKAVRGDKH